MATETETRPDNLAGARGRTDANSRSSANRMPARHGRKTSAGDGLATALGLFSIGLGLAQIFAPRGLTTLIGLRTDRGIMPMLGLREIATGIGILSRPQPTGWVAARVAGDVMDLALLAAASGQRHAHSERLAGAAAAVICVTALDVICAVQLRRGSAAATAGSSLRATRSITVNRPPDELYRFWRDFENLPRAMRHIASVRMIDDRRSHWVARAPGGYRVEWDSEIVDDRPGQYIAWQSLPGGDVPNSGSVRFDRAPGGRGTEIRVELEYRPPGGTLGAVFARLLGKAPERQTMEDLRRFKQLVETGEIATTDGQTSGRKGGPFGRRLSLARILEKEMR